MRALNNRWPVTAGIAISLLLFFMLVLGGAVSCGPEPDAEKTPAPPVTANAVPPGTVGSTAPPARLPENPGTGTGGQQAVVEGLEQGSDLAEMFLQAAELARTGVYDRALDLYREILESRPDHTPTLINAARIHFIRGRTGEAITLLEEANRTFPGHPRILGYLGMAEAKEGRFEDAVIHLEGSSLLDPNRIDVGNELAGAYYELKRYDDAAEAWARVLKLDPGNLLARAGLDQVRQLREQPVPNPGGPAEP